MPGLHQVSICLLSLHISWNVLSLIYHADTGSACRQETMVKKASSYILIREETGQKNETVQSCSHLVNVEQEFHRISCLTQSPADQYPGTVPIVSAGDVISKNFHATSISIHSYYSVQTRKS